MADFVSFDQLVQKGPLWINKQVYNSLTINFPFQTGPYQLGSSLMCKYRLVLSIHVAQFNNCAERTPGNFQFTFKVQNFIIR